MSAKRVLLGLSLAVLAVCGVLCACAMAAGAFGQTAGPAGSVSALLCRMRAFDTILALLLLLAAAVVVPALLARRGEKS